MDGQNNGLTYAPTEFSDSSYADVDISGIKRGLANVHLHGLQEACLSLHPEQGFRHSPFVGHRADSPTISPSHEQVGRSQPYMLTLWRGLLPVLGGNSRFRERSGSGSSSLTEFWLQSKVITCVIPNLVDILGGARDWQKCRQVKE
ncbi:unnamed protein product [Schistocephalus solidus]|uniref:Uncharacterized protein n=1 Tax=Schistocephalus solidus TaxID=70667 RepID=A0A183S8X3_SCHSO|nr:unnamed protein product [Schistocephalus solidus]